MIVDIVLICKLIYNEISFQEDYPRDQLKISLIVDHKSKFQTRRVPREE